MKDMQASKFPDNRNLKRELETPRIFRKVRAKVTIAFFSVTGVLGQTLGE